MKFNISDDITIFLNKMFMPKIDFSDREELENCINQIISKVENIYDIKLYGYYNARVYMDKYYGIIIKIKKEDLEYLDYFNEQLEINIELIEDTFLYKIEDLFNLNKNILKKCIIYKNKENVFLKPNIISNIELGLIIENAEIIYGKEAKNIIKKSQIVRC